MLSKSKAFSLLNLLKINELDTLKRNLVCDKRLRLLILLDHLIEQKNKPPTEDFKEKIFQKLFNKTYSKEKDYLLRNELRLLSDQIEKVLIEFEIREEVSKNKNASNYYLLRSLQERKALHLFEKEYKNAYDQAVKNSDYYSAHNISGLNFVNYTEFLNLKEKDLPYIEKLNDLKLTHLSCYYLTAFRNHQINAEYSKQLVFPFSIHERKLTKDVEVHFNRYESDYSEYLYLKAKLFLLPIEERIEPLEKCLDYVKNHLQDAVFFEDELKFCLSALARNQSLLFEFDKAADYFEEFFEISKDPDDPQHLAVLCDYLTKLIKLKRYEKAIDLIEKNGSNIEGIPRYQVHINCLKISTLALLGDGEKLYNELPQNLQDFNKNLKIFYRLFYAVQNYLSGDTEAALREIQNLDNAVRRSSLKFEVTPIIKFFSRFFYLKNHFLKTDVKLKSHLATLQKEIAEYLTHAAPEYKSYLPFIWLRRELEKDA